MKTFLDSVALLITIYFPPEPGGGASFAWNRAMILKKMGFSVFVLTGFPTYPTGKFSVQELKGKWFYVEKMENFSVIRLRLISLEHKAYLKRLLLFLNFVFIAIFYLPKILRVTGKINLVCAMSPIVFSSIIGFVYAKITKSFFIYEAPDLWPEELAVFKTRFTFIVIFIGGILARFAYSVPDIIVTVSDLAAEKIREGFSPKARVYAFPIGVEPKNFPKLSKEACRAELIQKKILPEKFQNRFIILYSGLISRAQRVETLVYVAKELKNEKEIAFLIVGDGEQKQNLERLKLENHLDNLELVSIQPRNLMPTIISAADICTVLLSPEPIFDIAVPTKFYEFLACNKPILGICKGDLAEIINSNNVGRTVNPNDINGAVSTIKNFFYPTLQIENIEDNCANTLKRFSLDRIASDFGEILMREMRNKKLEQ